MGVSIDFLCKQKHVGLLYEKSLLLILKSWKFTLSNFKCAILISLDNRQNRPNFEYTLHYGPFVLRHLTDKSTVRVVRETKSDRAPRT